MKNSNVIKSRYRTYVVVDHIESVREIVEHEGPYTLVRTISGKEYAIDQPISYVLSFITGEEVESANN